MDVTRDKLLDTILWAVNTSEGIKGVDLALKVLEKTSPNYFESHLYQSCIEELVEKNKILEVEYILPSERIERVKRIKSFYLPIGTGIKVHDNILRNF